MKKELLQLQVAVRERNIIPPKLNELVRVVSKWISGSRKSRSEKVSTRDDAFPVFLKQIKALKILLD